MMKRKALAILLAALLAAVLPAAVAEPSAEGWALTEETILGTWACAGAHDSYPFLFFHEDGTCDIFDYDDDAIPTIGDDEDAIYAFPGALRQTVTYELSDDGLLTLSNFDEPLTTQTFVAEEDMQTDSQLVKQGTEGFVMYEYVETADGLIPMEYVYFRTAALDGNG